MGCIPLPTLAQIVVVLPLIGLGLGCSRGTIDCHKTALNVLPRSIPAGEALARANEAMLGLQNKDSLFLPPALVVNAADEEFQGGQIADALRLLARARDRTDRVAHERVDRLSPWKGREGDAAVDDVCAALQLMDFAEQKVARVPHFSAPSREVGSPDGGERIPLRRPPIPAYDKPMAKAKKFELESAAPTLNEEDEETLAAIDEGIRDAKAGRTVPAEEVRKRLPKWITASSTRKGR